LDRGNDPAQAIKDLGGVSFIGDVIDGRITVHITRPIFVPRVGARVRRRYLLGAGRGVIAEGPNDAAGLIRPAAVPALVSSCPGHSCIASTN
jgi:hypothetical protein